MLTQWVVKKILAKSNLENAFKIIGLFIWRRDTMEITITLPTDLEQDLVRQADQTNTSIQTLILQALRQTMSTSTTSQWSETILAYRGVTDFPAFESYRDELLPPDEVELF